MERHEMGKKTKEVDLYQQNLAGNQPASTVFMPLGERTGNAIAYRLKTGQYCPQNGGGRLKSPTPECCGGICSPVVRCITPPWSGPAAHWSPGREKD